MAVHFQEVEAAASQGQGQPVLSGKTLSLKEKKERTEKKKQAKNNYFTFVTFIFMFCVYV